MSDGEWTGPSVGEIRLDSVWSVLSDVHYSSAHLLQGGAVPNHQPAAISPSSPAGHSPPPSFPPSLLHLCFNTFMLSKSQNILLKLHTYYKKNKQKNKIKTYFVCVYVFKVSYTHQGYIYLIKNTIKTVILWNIKAAVHKFCLFVAISVWKPGIAVTCRIISVVWGWRGSI